MNWKFWQRKPAPAPQADEMVLAHAIGVNVGTELQIKRNNARIARLQRMVEKGRATPAMEAELKARTKARNTLAELTQG